MNTSKTPTSLWRTGFDRLKQNRLALVSGIFLLLMTLSALLTPWLTPYDYFVQNLQLGATPPSAAHWLGTDLLGRDLMTRLMYGSRISLAVGFLATGIALIIGVTWGLIAGWAGGATDNVMMRILDILYGIPFILFIILLTVVFGRSIWLLFLAIGAVEWMTIARIVRAQTATLAHREFVLAATAMGVPQSQILMRHLFPNILGPVILYATLTIPNVIILEAFLSFLGLGVQPPQSSWGLLISQGVESMETHPWLLIFPGIFFSLTLFALNFLGDGLRDAFDPRTSTSHNHNNE
ncbi:MAG: ABC transporter permease [Gammaproteobacteria bacterium]